MAVNMNMMINAGMRDNEQQTGKFGAVSVSGKKQEVGKEESRRKHWLKNRPIRS